MARVYQQDHSSPMAWLPFGFCGILGDEASTRGMSSAVRVMTPKLSSGTTEIAQVDDKWSQPSL